jgi:hypothetical protein
MSGTGAEGGLFNTAAVQRSWDGDDEWGCVGRVLFSDVGLWRSDTGAVYVHFGAGSMTTSGAVLGKSCLVM